MPLIPRNRELLEQFYADGEGWLQTSGERSTLKRRRAKNHGLNARSRCQ
jgi:hypothetical protein